jgi:hypothetical protein
MWIERVGIDGSLLGMRLRASLAARRLARTIWPTGGPGRPSSAGGPDTLQRAASEVDRPMSLPPAPPTRTEQAREIAAQQAAALKELNAA